MKNEGRSEMYHFLSAPYIIDRKLYKYFSNVKYATDCIRNRRIHLDDPRDFNDPFDAVFGCSHISALDTTESEMELAKRFFDYVCILPAGKQSRHHAEIVFAFSVFLQSSSSILSSLTNDQPLKDVIEKIYGGMTNPAFSLKEFTETIEQGFAERERVMRLDCRISCFSEIKDSILMWSYYANSHQGVCVEFDLSLLDRNSELNRLIMKGMSKVHYSPLRADMQHSGSNASGLNFLVSKADVWEHEHEWRIICESNEEYLPFDCISNVYIGVRFDTSAQKYKDLVNAVNTHRNLAIHQCKLSVNKYQIEFGEVYSSDLYAYTNERRLRNVNERTSNIA